MGKIIAFTWTTLAIISITTAFIFRIYSFITFIILVLLTVLEFAVTLTGGSVSKQSPAKQETQVQSLFQEDPLEKEMATHSLTPVFLPGKSH